MKRPKWIPVILALALAAAGWIPFHALEVTRAGGAGPAVFLKRVAL